MQIEGNCYAWSCGTVSVKLSVRLLSDTCRGDVSVSIYSRYAVPCVPGWEQAVLVSSSIDAYYPLGGAACCTPSLLLETGDAWEFERCDCVASSDINCGGLSTHRLLFGFDHWRCAFPPSHNSCLILLGVRVEGTVTQLASLPGMTSSNCILLYWSILGSSYVRQASSSPK